MLTEHRPATYTLEDAALLDGLYSAVEDAGMAHHDAEVALRTARIARDAEALSRAETAVRAQAKVLQAVADTYRRMLNSLTPDARTAYLAQRHPYLYAG